MWCAARVTCLVGNNENMEYGSGWTPKVRKTSTEVE